MWPGCQVASGMSLPLCASRFSVVKWYYESDFPHRAVIGNSLDNWASDENRAGPGGEASY